MVHGGWCQVQETVARERDSSRKHGTQRHPRRWPSLAKPHPPACAGHRETPSHGVSRGFTGISRRCQRMHGGPARLGDGRLCAATVASTVCSTHTCGLPSQSRARQRPLAFIKCRLTGSHGVLTGSRRMAHRVGWHEMSTRRGRTAPRRRLRVATCGTSRRGAVHGTPRLAQRRARALIPGQAVQKVLLATTSLAHFAAPHAHTHVPARDACANGGPVTRPRNRAHLVDGDM